MVAHERSTWKNEGVVSQSGGHELPPRGVFGPVLTGTRRAPKGTPLSGPAVRGKPLHPALQLQPSNGAFLWVTAADSAGVHFCSHPMASLWVTAADAER